MRSNTRNPYKDHRNLLENPFCAFVRKNCGAMPIDLGEVMIEGLESLGERKSRAVKNGYYEQIGLNSWVSFTIKGDNLPLEAISTMFKGRIEVSTYDGNPVSQIQTIQPGEWSSDPDCPASCVKLCHPYTSMQGTATVTGSITQSFVAGTHYSILQSPDRAYYYIQFLDENIPSSQVITVSVTGTVPRGEQYKYVDDCEYAQPFDMELVAYNGKCASNKTKTVLYLSSVTAEPLVLALPTQGGDTGMWSIKVKAKLETIPTLVV